MINSKVYRKYYLGRNFVGEVFSRHKKCLIVLSLISLFCIILAISMIIQSKSSIELSNCLDKNLITFLNGNLSATSLFFKHLFGYIFIFLAIICGCYFKPFIPISCFLVIAKLFSLVFNWGVFVITYSLKGLIFYLICFLCNVAILLLLVFLICLSIENNACQCKGKNVLKDNFKIFIMLAILIIALLILECILLKIISPIVIIIV